MTGVGAVDINAGGSVTSPGGLVSANGLMIASGGDIELGQANRLRAKGVGYIESFPKELKGSRELKGSGILNHFQRLDKLLVCRDRYA
ncbi:MAG TPA: hypothetical protein ENI94_09945 [Gammaproteobacteria bacterium]|nr:hypothetical protein [Gammaproteobacteria bacterium]